MGRLILIGASGNGKVCADIAKLVGCTDIVFLDDNPNLKQCGRYKVIGKTDEARNLDGDIFVAIGDCVTRKKFCQAYEGRLMTLIHPDAVIAEDVEIGIGSAVMAGVVINSGTAIGKGCIVNTSSSVDHDCKIGDYVHVAVGAHLSGTVTVGENVWIGAGSVINNNVSICGDCVIGAGAVVTKNISDQGTYVGVPARRITKDMDIAM